LRDRRGHELAVLGDHDVKFPAQRLLRGRNRDDGLVVSPGLRGAWPFRLSFRLAVSLEWLISDTLKDFGPLVALGRPGERLPREGALRDYPSGPWKPEILAYMMNASAIVAVLAHTEGLMEEIRDVLAAGLLTKLIIVIPPLRAKELRRRWDALCQLTSLRDYAEIPPANEIAGFRAIIFDESNRAHGIGSRWRTERAYRAAISTAIIRLRWDKGARTSQVLPTDRTNALASTVNVAPARAESSGKTSCKLYTPAHVGLAALLGGPVAPALLAAFNWRRTGAGPWVYVWAVPAAAVTLSFWAVPDTFLIPLQVSLAFAIWLLFEARVGEGIETRLESQQSVKQPVWKTLSVGAATWLATSALFSLSLSH